MIEDKEVVLTGPRGCQGDDPGRVPAADHHLPHHGRVAAPLPCTGVRGHPPVSPLARARSPSVHRQAGRKSHLGRTGTVPRGIVFTSVPDPPDPRVFGPP
jgi:hypothetical protein